MNLFVIQAQAPDVRITSIYRGISVPDRAAGADHLPVLFPNSLCGCPMLYG